MSVPGRTEREGVEDSAGLGESVSAGAIGYRDAPVPVRDPAYVNPFEVDGENPFDAVLLEEPFEVDLEPPAGPKRVRETRITGGWPKREALEAARAAAEAEGIGLSELVRRAVKSYIAA